MGDLGLTLRVIETKSRIFYCVRHDLCDQRYITITAVLSQLPSKLIKKVTRRRTINRGGQRGRGSRRCRCERQRAAVAADHQQNYCSIHAHNIRANLHNRLEMGSVERKTRKQRILCFMKKINNMVYQKVQPRVLRFVTNDRNMCPHASHTTYFAFFCNSAITFLFAAHALSVALRCVQDIMLITV